MAEASEQALLAGARAGDQAALEELLRRYQPRVYRFGMRMCGDPEDAKDVLQETLLAMARSVRDFRGASSLSTWLYSIARSFCVKKRRRGSRTFAQARAAYGEEAARVADPRANPEGEVAEREIEALLARAIAALEPKSREILVLRDIEGLAATEVAEVVGISVEAVKSRLHRARMALRAALLPALGADREPGDARQCPDVVTLFSRHLEGEIDGETCARMERHLEGCAHCRGACESLKRTLALCHDAPAPMPAESVQREVRASLRRFLATQRKGGQQPADSQD